MLKSMCGLTVLALSVTAHTIAQTPAFDVASVRPVPRFDTFDFPQRRRPPQPRSSGQFDAAETLRSLIMWAFGVHADLIEGTSPILDDGFVIAAKGPGPVLLTPRGEVGPMNLMVQSLLADRFKLRVRREVRNRPTYALRRVSNDRLGPGLKPLTVECPPGHPENVNAAPVGCMSKFTIGVVTGVLRRISDFADALRLLMGRPVVDETGLTGAFEIHTALILNRVTAVSRCWSAPAGRNCRRSQTPCAMTWV